MKNCQLADGFQRSRSMAGLEGRSQTKARSLLQLFSSGAKGLSEIRSELSKPSTGLQKLNIFHQHSVLVKVKTYSPAGLLAQDLFPQNVLI